MSDNKPREGDGHQLHLFDRLPRYRTALICEEQLPYPARLQVRAPEDVAIVLKEYFNERDREEFLVLALNTANIITAFTVASVGGLAASIVEPRTVFRFAFEKNAAAIILAHNHPSGNPEPSREDIRVTRQIAETGIIVGVPVHDHLIITDHTFVSLAERGLMQPG